MLPTIRKITGATSLARFLAECGEPVGEIAVPTRTPYASSPTTTVSMWGETPVAVRETRHNRFEVQDCTGHAITPFAA